MKRKFFFCCALLLGSLSSACSGSGVDDSTLYVGLECGYAPFNWTEKAANDYTLPISNHAGSYADGYDIQIAKILSEKTGKGVKIVQTKWESLVTDLQSGSINCIIAGMTDTEEREKSIDFTSEYYRSELVLVVKKEVATANPDRISAANFGTFIKGKQIESQNQTLTDDIIQKVFVTYGAIHNTAVDTFASAATDVVNGSAFAMTAEYPVALSIIASNSALGMVRLDQSILGDNLKDLGVSIGVKKGSALKADLSTVLEGISQDQRNSLMAGAVARSSGASL
jgi:putative lysine transport system substrate-binding protein